MCIIYVYYILCIIYVYYILCIIYVPLCQSTILLLFILVSAHFAPRGPLIRNQKFIIVCFPCLYFRFLSVVTSTSLCMTYG